MRNLLLAFGYALFGRIALLLAIPPGHAITVFPPAGISVIAILTGDYRLLPGTALGSCIFNLWIGYEPSWTVRRPQSACAINMEIISTQTRNMKGFLNQRTLPG
ncbi:hypothetical protein [Undibacterium sp. TS12]|uniref:hypothetical protein n=1 Tax=Undibacterium sp. TS12 TaxID=2908202 RepID=UPI001F4D2B65|nr:hypothetical protein [Undibacterium sp. TS12]MCH8618504.1 hypothetical protein [Undibacterium sp. TS12]